MHYLTTLTLTKIETRTSATKGDYTCARAQLHKKDGTLRSDVRVMAFGPQRASVLGRLKAGNTITVRAVWDDFGLKILGPAEMTRYSGMRGQSGEAFSACEGYRNEDSHT